MNKDLTRFIDAQESVYSIALAEIRNGEKESHWMWFIFPQLAGLGHSPMAHYYAIQNLAEATAYLRHPVLGQRLIEITTALLGLKGKTARDIFGSPDDLKLNSCMTLFSKIEHAPDIFSQVIERYYGGKLDLRTLELLETDEE